MLNRSKPLVSKEKRGEKWYVIVLDADGKARQETAFKDEILANFFYLKEFRRLQHLMLK